MFVTKDDTDVYIFVVLTCFPGSVKKPSLNLHKKEKKETYINNFVCSINWGVLQAMIVFVNRRKKKKAK